MRMSVHIPTCKNKKQYIFDYKLENIIQSDSIPHMLVPMDDLSPPPPAECSNHRASKQETCQPSSSNINGWPHEAHSDPFRNICKQKVFNHCLTMANLTYRNKHNKHPCQTQLLTAGHRLPSTSWQSEQWRPPCSRRALIRLKKAESLKWGNENKNNDLKNLQTLTFLVKITARQYED